MLAAVAHQPSTLWYVLSLIVTAFFIGLFARFLVPGPDPMPAWLTIGIGLLASVIGYGIVIAIEGSHSKDVSWGGIASIAVAVCLVLLYRRFVQKRPLWGKGALRFPERGFGIARHRERLRKYGIDPDQIGTGQPFVVPPPGAGIAQAAGATRDHPGEPDENPAHYLGLLEELHDSGVLDDSEYGAAKSRLLEKLRP